MALYDGTPLVGIPADNKVVISTSIDIVVGQNKVGVVESFNPTYNRPVQRVRELNSETAGRTLEIAPSPEEFSINITGFMLYSSGQQHLFQRIAGTDGEEYISLSSQQEPFDIIETYTHPANNKLTFEVVYKGCWLTNYSKTQNIGTAIVAESATVEVTAVIKKRV